MLVKEKLNQARDILKEFDVDCWVTFVRESQINGDPALAFLVETDVTWHSAFIVTSSGLTHAIVGLYDKATIEEINAYDKVEPFVEGIKPQLQQFLKNLNPRQIAVNYSIGSEICDGITHGMYLTLYALLKEIGMENRLISAEKIVSALRQRKTKTELQSIKGAIDHTLDIFDKVTGYIKPGKTEKDIAAFMKNQVKEKGLELAWEETVCPAVFTGPAEAQAHYAPLDRKVQRGHILNMDFGVKVDGYCSDLQRTFYILYDDELSAPPDVIHGFDTIVKSVEKSKQFIKPGVLGKEIDAVARKIVTEAGYEEFPHALGHQVGRFSHDGTAILGPAWEKYMQKPFQPLEKNMVFTIEPRLTVENRGVATIEEMVVVTENGAEWLSAPQREIILIRA